MKSHSAKTIFILPVAVIIRGIFYCWVYASVKQRIYIFPLCFVNYCNVLSLTVKRSVMKPISIYLVYLWIVCLYITVQVGFWFLFFFLVIECLIYILLCWYRFQSYLVFKQSLTMHKWWHTRLIKTFVLFRKHTSNTQKPVSDILNI